jgi:hypothetical protein
MFRRQIVTYIDIQASPEEVWRHLTDFAAYTEWNPFIAGIEGEARAGSRLTVTMHLQRGKAMVFRPSVKAAEPGKKLVWQGRTIMPGLLDSEHSFVIEDKGDGTCRFVQSESFTGFLVPYLPRSMAEQTTLGFDLLNKVLKERVEGEMQNPGFRSQNKSKVPVEPDP